MQNSLQCPAAISCSTGVFLAAACGTPNRPAALHREGQMQDAHAAEHAERFQSASEQGGGHADPLQAARMHSAPLQQNPCALGATGLYQDCAALFNRIIAP